MNIEAIKTELEKLPKTGGYKAEQKAKEILLSHGIEVMCTGGVNLGRCYYASYYEVCSSEELSEDFILYLRKMRMLGYGQEFGFKPAIERDGKWIVKAEARVDSSD